MPLYGMDMSTSVTQAGKNYSLHLNFNYCSFQAKKSAKHYNNNI